MAYVVIRPDVDINQLNTQGAVDSWVYKNARPADLGQSFARLFIAFEHNDGTPVQFGEFLHLNDRFTEGLFSNVRMNDYQNNIELQSSSYPLNQAVAWDLLQLDQNYIGGFNSNSFQRAITSANTVGLAIGGALRGELATSTYIPPDELPPFDFNVGHNLDDLNNNQYARWGETLEPFAKTVVGLWDYASLQGSDNSQLVGMSNRAGLTRLKRHFMFGNANATSTAESVNNIAPYIYKPTWCDLWDHRKSYWTNDFRIQLIRGNDLVAVQYPDKAGGSAFPLLPINQTLKERGLRIVIKQMDFLFYVNAAITITPRARDIVWTTNLRYFPINSPYFLRDNVIEGPYDFAFISFILNSALGSRETDKCIYKSGLDIETYNGATVADMPKLGLQWMVFRVDHGDQVVRIPDNEDYQVEQFDTATKQSRIDLLTVYVEYLKACGLNAFSSDNRRAKVDYASFISQMLYVPVSMRKDREYFSKSPQPVTKLNVEMQFDQSRNTDWQQNLYTMVVTGFRKIFLN